MDQGATARDSKQAAIRRAAAEALAAGARHRVSSHQIAEAAGTTGVTLKYHFGNIDRLVWDIVARHVNAVLDRMHVDAPEDMPPRDRWLALARSYAATVQHHGPEHRTAIAYEQHLDERRHGDARVLQRYVLQAFIDALREAAPGCPAGHVNPLALSLVAMLNAQAAWFRPGAGMGRMEYAEMAARMVLREADA